MKQLLAFIFLFVVILHSCAPDAEERNIKQMDAPKETHKPELIDGEIQIIKVDGCEYLFFYIDGNNFDGGPAIEHKGDCSNKIHLRYN